jgi:hypothetical protein
VSKSVRGGRPLACAAVLAGALAMGPAAPALATNGAGAPAKPGGTGTASKSKGHEKAGTHGSSHAPGQQAKQGTTARPGTTAKPGRTATPATAKTPAARSAGSDPRGNNGTVKIDGPAYGAGVANEAHVACEFRIKFFGFDAGQRANLTLTAHAPTRGGVVWHRANVLISDDAAGGAGRDADAIVGPLTADDLALAGVTPAKQGYHLKLAVDVLGAPGGSKQKVFWLEPCTPATAPAAGAVLPSPSLSATPVPGGPGDTGTGAVPAPAVQGAVVTRDGVPAVAAGQADAAAAERARVLGLPVTGVKLGGLLALGLGLIAAGAVLVRRFRVGRTTA